ncbi:hypothetical protein SAMN05444401_0072 [Clostridium amylolyticum]|uniref:Uncharacterized protein n=1 Tax=Clostridium amylolyticum TaxID=1121298 RepID=A0A1M6N3M2_9CLOT|nr:hypothetical protein [Clostridium amylolyticum]SHJ90267.1 hypothetical protein SAMN05444401_0072 [Clostridium amylolyticum]
MKKVRIFVVIFLLISIGILAFYFIPMRITPRVPLTSEDISIKVERAGGNTGPVFIVDKDKTKLKNILQEKYPDKDIEPYYIELTGNLPNGVVIDPSFLGSYVVHGTIISPDGGEEKSTIIDVKYTDAKISRFFRDDLPKSEHEILNVLIALVSSLVSIFILIIIFLARGRKTIK